MKSLALKRLLVTSALLLWSMSSLASGQFSGPSRDANGNVVPSPKGEQCVEPTADMRANHMKYLLHKRDLTMYDGIRTKQHSIVACIDCHATPNEDGKIVRIHDDSNEHFCASCHAVTSVKLDCFECHADRPVEAFSDANKDPVQALDQALAHSARPHAVMNRKVQ